MRDHLNATDKRRLHLVEILSSENRPFTLNTLSKRLNVSERTIQSDLHSFKDLDYIFDVHTNNLGVKLIYNNNQTIHSIYNHARSTNLACVIALSIFLNPDADLDDLANMHHHSKSSILRAIKTSNQVSKERFGVSINTASLEFEGDEIHIRFYIAQHFYERLPIEWPLDFIDEGIWDKFLDTLLQIANIPLDFTLRTYLKYTTLVNFLRLIQGHSVRGRFNIGAEPIWEMLDGSQFYEDFCNHYSAIFGTEVNRPFFEELFFPYLQKEYATDYAHLLSLEKNYKEVAHTTNSFRSLMDSLTKTGPLTISNPEEFIVEIYNLLLLENVEPNSNYIFFDTRGDFCKKARDHFPNFYQNVEDSMKTLLEKTKGEVNDIFLNHMIYSLFTRWRKLIPQLLASQSQAKILVISDLDTFHTNLLKDSLESQFPNRALVYTYERLKYDIQSLKQGDYDLIISTFALPQITHTQVFYVSSFISEKNIEEIQQYLFQ